MPKSNVTVKLATPIATHKGPVSEATFRPPTLDEYLDIGETHTLNRTPGGGVIVLEDKSAIRDYIERLVVAPLDGITVLTADFGDAKAIKGAVLSFFLPDAPAAARSPTSPENSSGTPTNSAPQTSSE